MSRGCCSLALIAASMLAPPAPAAGRVPEDVAGGLRWRLVGPLRAGWGSAVVGIPDQPDVFYSGAAGGGVWKTTDAGNTWAPLFQDGPPAIGAIAIARSDPRVIYVGTGQITSRYDVGAGEGLFRSGDGGQTWTPAGLADTRHIAQILIDPHDPDSLLVAALGHVFGPNDERGVFRSEDGGKSWTRTLFVSENTGAVDIAADPDDGRIVFAAVWQVRYQPWLSYFTPDAGPESGVYKSTDGGRSWRRLAGRGWPGASLGRIGLAAAHTETGTRVYAVITAEERGGLYRSDDAGESWQHANGDHELNDGYFARVTAMPGDPDTVFVMGRSMRRCSAGGTACEIVKGSPGGDDYHDLWINPVHPDHRITGSDQGSVVTVDGGVHWSSWYNQPTGQMYHLAADDRFPYWIYAAQQDNGTVRVASRSDYGSLTFRDWSPVGADERDYVIPDPVDPDIVYGSGLGGRLSRWDARNGEVQNISPWPVGTYAARPTTVRFRYTWITPIALSRLPPYPLYQGAQLLFRSPDRGAHWERISPDLSAKSPDERDCAGTLDRARARDCGYGVIASIGLSPRDNDEIWIGTDDGLVHVTRDAGHGWRNVTPRAVPPWAKIATVDVGPRPGSATIAVDNHRQDDFEPHAFRTRDHGASWTSIVGGLPAGHFVSVVRADPVTDGLLYLGTDRGVFVSFDDGDHWRSLQRNLPSSIVTDLLVHEDDLIVCSQGHGIWVLDGLGPLRQAAAIAGNTAAHLFAPDPAMRVRENQNKDTPLPPEEPASENPPTGALIDYWLARDAGRVEIVIRDGRGNEVRHFASDDPPEPLPAERYFAAGWLRPASPLAATAGAHRFAWDLRYPRPQAPEYEYSIAAVWGQDTPLLPAGMLVPPGDYTVVLRVDGREYSAALSVRADPRVPFDAPAARAALALSADVQDALGKLRPVSAEAGYIEDRLSAIEPELETEAARAALLAYRKALDPLVDGEGDGGVNLDSIGRVLRSLEIDLEGSDRAPTEPQRQVLEVSVERLERARTAWDGLRGAALGKLNAVLVGAGVETIRIPPLAEIPVRAPRHGKELP